MHKVVKVFLYISPLYLVARYYTTSIQKSLTALDFYHTLAPFIGYEPTYKNVIVYKNGYSDGGVPLMLNSSSLGQMNGESLAVFLSQYITVDTIVPEDKDVEVDPFADRVFNGNGKLLKSYADIRNGDRLYLVAKDLHFVWPFVKYGHRVYVDMEASPLKMPVIIESMTESPRTFRLHNFFSEEEADSLIKSAMNKTVKLQRASVGSVSKSEISSIRTSDNAFDTNSPTSQSIRDRVFDMLAMNNATPDMADGLQLLRYQQKQAYTLHSDYFGKTKETEDYNWNPQTGGNNRFATVFFYLSNVTKGGQTVFPHASIPEQAPVEYQHPSDVAEYGKLASELFDKDSWEADMITKCTSKLAYYPRKGGAILFYSQKPNGQLDDLSKHGGCPVLEGTKWAANFWIWNKNRYIPKNDYQIVIKNPTQRTVDVYWTTTKMTTLEPGKDAIYTTYTGHEWIIKDGEEELLRFTGNAVDGNQTISVPIDHTDSDSNLAATENVNDSDLHRTADGNAEALDTNTAVTETKEIEAEKDMNPEDPVQSASTLNDVQTTTSEQDDVLEEL